MKPPTFELHVHDSEDRDRGGRITLPIMPYPGLVILHKTGTWEVQKVQILARDRDSLAEKHDDPHMVMVLAKSLESASFFD